MPNDMDIKKEKKEGKVLTQEELSNLPPINQVIVWINTLIKEVEDAEKKIKSRASRKEKGIALGMKDALGRVKHFATQLMINNPEINLNWSFKDVLDIWNDLKENNVDIPGHKELDFKTFRKIADNILAELAEKIEAGDDNAGITKHIIREKLIHYGTAPEENLKDLKNIEKVQREGTKQETKEQ